MPHRLPVAVYCGPDHILVHVNEVWRTLFEGEPPLEMPAREAFMGEGWAAFVRAMDDAYRSGEKRYTPCDDHDSTVVILPLKEDGRTVGLVTACRLERVAPMRAGRPQGQPNRPTTTAASLPVERPWLP